MQPYPYKVVILTLRQLRLLLMNAQNVHHFQWLPTPFAREVNRWRVLNSSFSILWNMSLFRVYSKFEAYTTPEEVPNPPCVTHFPLVVLTWEIDSQWESSCSYADSETFTYRLDLLNLFFLILFIYSQLGLYKYIYSQLRDRQVKGGGGVTRD